MVREALDKSGNAMRIIAYSDEVTPGNQLADHNSRKLQAVYWSWYDLGFPTLCNELAWNTLAGVRSDTLPGETAPRL
eukprot:8703907-Pyramimonas_sp.AAC.1